MVKSAALALALWCVAAPASAQTEKKETVVWAINNFSPYVIVDGPNKGQGIIDQIRDLMIKRLSDWNHEQVVSMTPRIMEMMKSQPNVCVSTLLRNPDRESVMDFTTLPTLRIMPNGVITSKERGEQLKPYLNSNGELRLDAVLAEGKYKLGIDRARSFGRHIDGLLKNQAAQGAIVTLTNTASLGSKLMRLANPREREFDLTIGYAIEMKAAADKFDLKDEEFTYFPVAGENELLSIPVACSKSELGKKIVAAAEKMLAEPAMQQEMTNIYRKWLGADAAKLYDRMLKQPAPK